MYFIDIQGTLIDDEKKLPIDGALAFIDKLHFAKIPFVLITNNTKKDSKNFVEYLKSLGFKVDLHNYIDPLMVMDLLISNQKIAPFAHMEFIKILEERGYIIDFSNPDVVLVGLKKDYNNEDFAQMIKLILDGAKIVGAHSTSLYAKDGKRYPGVGAILKMLSFATGKDYTVVGKPSVDFYTKAKELLGAKSFNEITIISDDYVGDLIGAKELGMKSVLVLSGKIKSLSEISGKPDEVYNTIGGLL